MNFFNKNKKNKKIINNKQGKQDKNNDLDNEQKELENEDVAMES